MKIKCPIRKTVWGAVNTLDELKKHIGRSGQFFGQDLSGPACEFKPEYPCDQTLYQYMGWGSHKGLDIPVVTGTEIYASHDGTVVKTSDSITGGIGVVLESLDEEFETVYWHLQKYLVSVGQKVKVGDLIAYSDNTGYSKGPHLHFEQKVWIENQYKPIDPIPNFVFTKNMTEQDVKRLYALAFYRLPDDGELSFWTGKDLAEFLKTAIKDRAEFLQNQI